MHISIVSLKDGNFLVGRGKKSYFERAPLDLPAFYAPDFFLKDQAPWFTHESTEIVSPADFNPIPAITLPKGDLKDLRAMFDDMHLTKGVIYSSRNLESFNWEHALSHLIEKGKAHYIYGTEGILGATPELLFDREKGKVTLMSLAATSKNPLDLNQEKEVEEQSIVTHAIREALESFGRVVTHPNEIASYGTLYHTKTTMTLFPEDSSSLTFDHLVKALHPTPALGAYPREEGLKWLTKWEKINPRYRFGAPFGYQLPERDEARAFVAIRCVQWRENSAEIWAGAGVTAKSDFAKEREEVLQKMDSIANLMGI